MIEIKFSCTPSTTSRYSILSVGAGSNVKVQVPSLFDTASGPPVGFQPHQGPVNLTLVAVAQTLVVICKGAGPAASTVTVLTTSVAAFSAPSLTL